MKPLVPFAAVLLLGRAAFAQEPPAPPVASGGRTRASRRASGRRARPEDERPAHGLEGVRSRGRGGLRRGAGGPPAHPAHQPPPRGAPASGPPGRHHGGRRHQPQRLVRRKDGHGARRRAERLRADGRAPDHRRGHGHGPGSDGDGDPARGLPLLRRLRPSDGERRARRLPRHPRRGRHPVPPPGVPAGDDRLAALDRRGPAAAAPEARDRLQDRRRGAPVRGDDPEVEPRGRRARRDLRVPAASRARGRWSCP